MRGVFLDSYYKLINGMKMLLLCLSILGGLIIVFVDEQLLIEGYMLAIFLSISTYSLSNNGTDIELGWSSYELILPVKRSAILKSKYLVYLFWVALAAILTLIYVQGVLLFKGNQYFDLGMKDIVTIFVFTISFCLQLCAWFYPIWYFVDSGKKKLTIILSLLLSISFMVGLVWVLNIKNIGLETGRIVCFLVSLISVLVSYMIAKRIYESSEF